jgi:hypothetical protein
MAHHTRSLRKRPPTRGAGAKPGTVVVENVTRPGTSRSVDAGKYGAMRQAVLRVLPRQAPGMTLADALAAVLPLLPQALFPEGAAAGWWFKTVQLDLEAKRQIVRGRTSPIRLHRI